MKVVAIILLISALMTQEIPFKPKTEFEVAFRFEFRKRAMPEPLQAELTTTRDASKVSGPLPYAIVTVSAVANHVEARVKVLDNRNAVRLNRKLDNAHEWQLNLGFTDDLKDQVTAHHFTIFFQNHKREPVSKIEINFDSNGYYYVNGEKRGRI